MKKIIAALTLLSIITASALCVGASDFYVYENPRELPASVYWEPYMDTQYSTTYAPWLRNIHLTSQAEIDRGDYGGEACQLIRVMAISPLNPDIMYFGTDTTGIFKTTNGGKNWYNTCNGYPGFYSQALMCDRFDENTVYYKARTAGLARSRDGGKTWEELIPDKTNPGGGFVSLLDMDDAGNLYAALPTGIYKVDRKTDEVTNFLPQYAALTGKNGVIFNDIGVSGDGMHIYASASANANNEQATPGLYVSHDGGKTWNIKGTNDKTKLSTQTLAIYPENPYRVFIGGAFTDIATGKADVYKLYESTDGGETFTEKYILNYENKEEGVEKTSKGFVYMDFGPKNKDGIYPLYIVGNQITYPYRVSYDYGNSFSLILTKELSARTESTSTSRHPAGVWSTGWWAQGIAIDRQNPGRLLLSEAGPVLYDNGKVEFISSGYSGASVTDIALDSKMRAFFVIVDAKIGITESGSFKDGEIPTVKFGRTGIFGAGSGDYDKSYTFRNAVIDPNDDNHVLAYSANNNATPDSDGVRQSFDGGKTWEPINPETEFVRKSNPAPVGATKVFCYDNEDDNTIYTTYHTSHDNGKTWEENEYYLMAFSKKHGRMLGMKGKTKTDAEFFVSDDKGKTWTPVLKPGYIDFDCFVIDDGNKDHIWFTRYWALGRIEVENKTIVNFGAQAGGNGTFNVVEQNPNNANHLLAVSRPGTISDKDRKLMETLDGGKTWHAVPGMWGGLFSSIHFISDKAYIGGHQGLLEYDYKKYHEFLASKITIMMNDKEVSFDEMPQIVNGRTMVPMRGLFEMLGATVHYNDETRLITATKGRDTITLTPGSDKATVNGEEIVLDAAPFITPNGRTMVPVRFIAESLDVRVGWDNAARTVYIRE